MKKIICVLVLTALLPVALMVGCGSSNPSPSAPVGPTTTYTPAPYTTPQATPQAAVVLNTSANYVILSYTGITNSGPSTTCGGYGVYPDGQTSVTGSPAIVEVCGGLINVGNSAADTAKIDLSTAYTNAMGRSGGATLPPGADIGGQTLYPGLYFETANLNISSADLTLNGDGNINSIFIFQIKSNLIVGPGRHVILTNGAQAANVFWAAAGYCSLNTTASMVGNIMTYTSVTLNTGAVLTGRALAENGNVTLLTNTITHP
ncbi:MAG TPA: ice-binding family protein [bacterium]|nr:ice-binding family protein [bacterium]